MPRSFPDIRQIELSRDTRSLHEHQSTSGQTVKDPARPGRIHPNGRRFRCPCLLRAHHPQRHEGRQRLSRRDGHPGGHRLQARQRHPYRWRQHAARPNLGHHQGALALHGRRPRPLLPWHAAAHLRLPAPIHHRIARSGNSHQQATSPRRPTHMERAHDAVWSPDRTRPPHHRRGPRGIYPLLCRLLSI